MHTLRSSLSPRKGRSCRPWLIAVNQHSQCSPHISMCLCHSRLTFLISSRGTVCLTGHVTPWISLWSRGKKNTPLPRKASSLRPTRGPSLSPRAAKLFWLTSTKIICSSNLIRPCWVQLHTLAAFLSRSSNPTLISWWMRMSANIRTKCCAVIYRRYSMRYS